MDVILKANQMDTPEEQRSPKGSGKLFSLRIVLFIIYY